MYLKLENHLVFTNNIHKECFLHIYEKYFGQKAEFLSFIKKKFICYRFEV